MSFIELIIPDIGGHSDVNVAELYVKVGDKINIDDNLLMLETDKATMEVPASASGVVAEVLIQVGSKVNEGDVVVKLHAEATQLPVASVAPVAVETAPSVASSASSTTVVPIVVPELSGHHDVAIIEVSVKVGDTIKEEDILITLETDKATMEVPATASGVVTEVKVQVGGKVNQGDLIVLVANEAQPVATVGNNDAPAPVAPASITTPAVAPVESKAVTPVAIDEVAFAKAFASPSIRKIAREFGVDLGKVKGSGNKGRITEDDVKIFVKGVMSGQIILNNNASATNNGGGLDLLPWPKVDFAKFGEVDVQEMSRIKKISSANMARNWVMIPHVTYFDKADITELEAFRKQLNEEYKRAEIKVTPLAFIIKAAVFALKKFPELNASIDGQDIVYKRYYNIGFAADTPNGLTVPVIKNADQKGLVELAQETASLAKAAREGKLKPTDMQGGTFTISSLGGLGTTSFTPIVNAPEVAILGVSKSAIEPVWNGKEFAPRLMLPLSLSADHRLIDGALAAKFTSYLVQILSDLRRLAL
ncbi:MAG: dihydrolipoyllysine-residue acetyltransferase [Pseudomonadota bacterium]